MNKIETKTRSDLLIMVSRLDEMTTEEKTEVILAMRNKIENIYKILFYLEKRIREKKWEIFAPIRQLLRQALES